MASHNNMQFNVRVCDQQFDVRLHDDTETASIVGEDGEITLVSVPSGQISRRIDAMLLVKEVRSLSPDHSLAA